jgi:hypothetical protein
LNGCYLLHRHVQSGDGEEQFPRRQDFAAAGTGDVLGVPVRDQEPLGRIDHERDRQQFAAGVRLAGLACPAQDVRRTADGRAGGLRRGPGLDFVRPDVAIASDHEG